MADAPAQARAGQGFPKSRRLLKSADFQRVFAQGRKTYSSEFVIYVLPNAEAGPRLGMAVSRKVGKAVLRGRIKRLLREAFRLEQARWPAVDVVVVARAGARALTLDLARQRLEEALLPQPPKPR